MLSTKMFLPLCFSQINTKFFLWFKAKSLSVNPFRLNLEFNTINRINFTDPFKIIPNMFSKKDKKIIHLKLRELSL